MGLVAPYKGSLCLNRYWSTSCKSEVHNKSEKDLEPHQKSNMVLFAKIANDFKHEVMMEIEIQLFFSLWDFYLFELIFRFIY